MKKRILSFLLVTTILFSMSIFAQANTGGGGGGASAGSSGGSTNSGSTDGTSTVAAELAQFLNEIQDGVCSFEDDVVTLEDDLILTEIIVVPTGENVILDTYRYDIIAQGDIPAIIVPEGASLTVGGSGMVMGGTDENEGNAAIINYGELFIDDYDIDIVGGGTIVEESGDSGNGSGGGSLGGSSGGASGGSSSGSGGTRPGSSGSTNHPSFDGGGGDGGGSGMPRPIGKPGEYETEETVIPGTVYALNGGVGIHNEGDLYLNAGKIVGGFGTESNGSALSGNITGGECIVHSDDDQDYELISSSSTDKRYIFFREATTAESLYIALVIANDSCCEYSYTYDADTDDYEENIILLSDVTMPSWGGNFYGGSLELDLNEHTINIAPDDNDDNQGGLYVYYIHIKGNGIINGNIYFGNAIIDNGTIKGDLVADSVGMRDLIINGGTINGSIVTLGGTLEINNGIVNGLIEAHSTDIVVNGGVISGGTNSWPFEIGDRLSSVYHGGELVWQHLYDGNLGTIWIRSGDITVNGGKITGWVDNDGKTGHPAITYTEEYNEQPEVHLIFDGGEITGGIGSQTSGKAVAGLLSKNEGVIIKESANGEYWTVLEENSTEKTYLKAGTEYCISVKNGKAYKTENLTVPIMEATAGDNITLVADSTPTEKMFKEWSISGAEVENSTNKTVTFTMPESNVVCEAVYMSENWYEIAAGDTSAIMNGQDYVMTVIPVSQNQKVFASPRDLADGMGVDCTFNGETQEITFATENKQLTYVLGSEYCISLEDQILVDVKAVMDIFLAEDFWVIGDENKVVAKKKTDENTATITLSAQNGSVTGAGNYYMGSSITISTTTNSGYSFAGWYEGETQVSTNATYTFVADADKALVAKSTRSYGGYGGGAIAATLSQTVKNDDGTVTYIKTVAGKTVKETTLLDGSKKVEEISKDGTEKITITDKNGNTETTTKYPDGTKIVEKKIKNGISVKTVTTSKNETSAVITGTESKETAIAIPIEDVSNGTVAVVVDDDGTEQVIKNCLPTEEGLKLTVSEDTEIKIVDRSKAFADTEGHWANDSIDFVVARDLFKGTSEKEFSPDAYMTRGMFAVVLHNYENNPEFKAEGQFFDVASNSWYKESVDWLYDKGVVSGYEDGSFGAEDNITREQLITLFYRYAGNPQYSNKNIEFNDAADISEYAKDAILWAIEKGIINGKEDNNFDPKGTATRAECAAIVQRFIKTIKAAGI